MRQCGEAGSNPCAKEVVVHEVCWINPADLEPRMRPIPGGSGYVHFSEPWLLSGSEIQTVSPYRYMLGTLQAGDP